MAEPFYVVCGASGHVGGTITGRLLDAKKRVRVEMSRGFNEGRIRALQPRSAATSTSTSIETFAEKVFAPAYRAA